jgi:hypothetical protein
VGAEAVPPPVDGHDDSSYRVKERTRIHNIHTTDSSR